MFEAFKLWIISSLNSEFVLTHQSLIGAALGPFLAIMLSLSAFLLKRLVEKRANRIESFRRVEVALTQSINDLLALIDQLKEFTSRVQTIISEIKKIPSGHATYAINETNFPPIIDISYDPDLEKMSLKSYYLHNKVLGANRYLKWCRASGPQYRNDFTRLLEKNYSIVAQRLLPHKEQREAYADNLDGFIGMLNVFISSLEGFLKELVQTKIYNNKLRKFFHWFFWKNEGASFKYFKSKGDLIKFSQSLTALDRVDKNINKDVESLLQEISKMKSNE